MFEKMTIPMILMISVAPTSLPYLVPAAYTLIARNTGDIAKRLATESNP